MKKFNEWLAAKSITPDQFAEFDVNKQAELYNEYNDQFRVKIEELSKTESANKEAIIDLQKQLASVRDEQFESLKAALKEQGVELKKLRDGESSSVNSKSFTDQLKEKLLANKEKLEALSRGDKGNFAIEVKAPANMALGTNVTGQVPQAERIPGLNIVASRQVRFLDLLTAGTIAGSNVIEWVYQANKDGAANVTGEGLIKNQIDFDLVVGSQKVEKITAYIKVTTEMLNDISWMQSEINNELTRELLKKAEQQAYAGTGVSPQLNGVRTVAVAFTGGSAALSVDNANEFDVLHAAALQIEEADQPSPNFAFVHPSIYYKIMHLKVSATDRRYVEYNEMISVVDGMMYIGGMMVVKSTLVAPGDFLVGYSPYANFYTKEAMSITVGLDSDDFTKNFRTVLAEWRGVVFVKNNDRTAFVKGDFTTAKAALETP
ncbi:MAG TPA: phage major capsid protein [Luteibaculaceae bacterium]|nr:phage major capsid protein [Luteibaculaceae bacterium]